MSNKDTFLKKSPKRPTKKTLLSRLVDFYWQILQDPDLKPSDRIASAKRLEALFAEPENDQDTPKVKVILNIPND